MSSLHDQFHYLLIVTLLWKLGAAPVHSWAPDLYDTVSMPVVLWMLVITWLGGASALFGAAAGVVENDLDISYGHHRLTNNLRLKKETR